MSQFKNKSASDSNNPQFAELLEYIRTSRGFDFTGYKPTTLMRRVNKRMNSLTNIENFTDYQDYLEVHPEEFNNLFNTILINVTSFFRDAAAWEYLRRRIIPEIVEKKPADEPIRVWSAGCASGEEAYSLAISLAETLGMETFRRRVKIYATDIDEEALAQARQASYPSKNLKGLAENLRERYFELVGDNYVFRTELRRLLIFGRHNLVQDAPISRLDLLVCRNTLMYFNSELQNQILSRFHFALNSTGFLFLGKAEMLLTHANLFTPSDVRYRIFSKTFGSHVRPQLPTLTPTQLQNNNFLGLQIRLRQQTFNALNLAQIVVDANGNLLLANDRAMSDFNIGTDDVGRPFQDLEVSYRPIELRSLIEEASTKRFPVSRSDIERRLPSGLVNLEVYLVPLIDNDNSLLGVSILFEDVTRYHEMQEELWQSRQTLENTYEELQAAYEELETTNEELQSTNEELETTNEELHSTNEELETTNEELQSTVEELETMNEELHSTNEEIEDQNKVLHRKGQEVNEANALLSSILAGLRSGIIVLDSDTNILIWNYQAEDFWGLRSDEVQGKSLFALDIGLPTENLRESIRVCLAEESDYAERVLAATNRRGRQFNCHLAITPLKNANGACGGIILLMEEVAP